MTRAEVDARARAQFALFDANGDGRITIAERDQRRETAQAERETRSKERRDAMFTSLDANGDGSISRAEFDAFHAGGEDKLRSQLRDRDKAKGNARTAGLEPGPRPSPLMMSDSWFAATDANKDQVLSEGELVTAALARFDATDSNKDGALSRDERRAAREAWADGARPKR